MARPFDRFESLARRAHRFTERDARDQVPTHPFDERGIHAALPHVVRSLFDNGHYAQATFEAFKYVDKLVEHLGGASKTGVPGMMQAFSETSPLVQLTPCLTTSDKDEQEGYKFLFAGSILAIRNPRGHEFSVKDGPDTCLDHLALASMLLRRLESAGYDVSMT
ncbi:MAG: TIGR02391 family protein [Coriobacteriales bacterium]|nr:TIGR02391 family protein [Actinomycetes bacterium]